ncbi:MULTISPECIES: phosphoadenosine phosphosulfate reductase domain-containing protein [Sphingomonadales]|jgi:3'-phosphoadenosine 5'-phosphosulfate sulfotransferase (PAPS reductase)/FAD synthetase|uniref:Phosphoadenosine phosphosulfate reductase family protein n=2 Tax=Sphingomonadaceae TaxID=41297 RepID=A0A397PAE1_9SPHN|nr:MULTISPECIES: phosphoadenosine phosphosulfate reductase family protein [Sphingomonadaceae]EKU73325.1 hypothetical protein HMPREF9718_03794 [Sphingobium yanoikuyae ATCC 51230]RIA46042.1 phosphoadenosine phosphosulfate reductase family protein [Hephaestia caeni]WQE08107.1 phosphoadenosine phosphosulfate reductase family protein [Sphingobium yanoikuyae]
MSLPNSASQLITSQDIPVAFDSVILSAVEQKAWFAFSLSGGKDSTLSAWAAMSLLDRLGHPRDRRIAIHADLGRAEWRSTPAMVEEIAARLDVPLAVVRRPAGDMVARWEQRFESGKARYEALETYNLIGPWSSASLRFCQSEMKATQIGPELARRFRGETIVSVIGLRREESVTRRFTPVSREDHRFAKPGNRAGTHMISWHPLVHWTAAQVFAAHVAHNLPLHEAYARYGAGRLSCAFCVLASLSDIAASTCAPGNLDLYRHLVAIEADSTFSFQPGRWLADVAPQLLQPSLLRTIHQSKIDAGERRRLESSMPPHLRFVKGWPPCVPTSDEAAQIATVRSTILRRHGLQNLYPTGADVRARFGTLLALKDARHR